MNSRHIALISFLSLVTAGCTLGGGGGGSSSTTTPISPTATATTETFNGTVSVGGNDSHNFTVAQSGGQVNVILTAAGPPATIFMGVGVGTPNGASCTVPAGQSVLVQAGSSAQTSGLSGTANAGTLCVSVFDAGNQSAPVTYTVTVSHF